MYFPFFVIFLVVNLVACLAMVIGGGFMREDAYVIHHSQRKDDPDWRMGLLVQKLGVVGVPIGILLALVWPVEAVLGALLAVWYGFKFLRGLFDDIKAVKEVKEEVDTPARRW